MPHNIAVSATTPLGPQEDHLEEHGEEKRDVQYLAGFEARQRVIHEFLV